ncbi:hypothetical protein T265_06579 [Opisthorchis viverrini]|uniref:Uncharacterized protein n=1 Tax=Opisthorchis viverrini TaxID=6198 RepID=A0A075ADJ8_OPIVI|nr:hypothetical protein T265_06579 [Opisthorchis viverrini]KER26099.1 hypothetical protein T265_06579 [Opisthorchis viverrini]
MKEITKRLCAVAATRLPGWGPRDAHCAWLETLQDMVANRCQWSFCCLFLSRSLKWMLLNESRLYGSEASLLKTDDMLSIMMLMEMHTPPSQTPMKLTLRMLPLTYTAPRLLFRIHSPDILRPLMWALHGKSVNKMLLRSLWILRRLSVATFKLAAESTAPCLTRRYTLENLSDAETSASVTANDCMVLCSRAKADWVHVSIRLCAVPISPSKTKLVQLISSIY